MTKTEEINALKAFAESIPRDSYLLPWLNYAIPEIERDILSDIFPTVMPSRARHDANAIRLEARKEAEAVLQSAQNDLNRAKIQAQEIMQAARDHGKMIVATAQKAIANLPTWSPPYTR